MTRLPDFLWHPVEIVYGVYQLHGLYQGDDRWWIQRLVESETGWMAHNDVYLDLPQRRYITADVELSDDWEWCYFNLRDERGTLLAAEVEQGKLVVEHNSQVSELPFDAESELSFLSPFLRSLTLRRMGLQVGDSATRRVVSFDGTTFAPSLVTQSYTRGEDITLDLGSLQVEAQQIHLFSHESGTRVTLLVREDGLVLRHPGRGALILDERASAGRGRMPPLGFEQGSF